MHLTTQLLAAIYTKLKAKSDNLLDLTIFLMLFLSFLPKLIKDSLILPDIFKKKSDTISLITQTQQTFWRDEIELLFFLFKSAMEPPPTFVVAFTVKPNLT